MFSFFRLFDIAFFAPGTLLFLALYVAEVLPRNPPSGEKLTTSESIVSLLVAMALIYLLGLLTHGVQSRIVWPLGRRWKKEGPKEGAEGQGAPGEREPAWFQRLSAEPRENLSLYFWYMRATCRNLAVALPAAALLLFAGDSPGRSTKALLLGIAVLGAVLLVQLSREYDDALERSTRPTPSPSDGKNGSS